MYDNGDTDYSIGFEYVVAPGGARLAAVYDDFIVGKDKHLVFDAIQILVAADRGKSLCAQYSPSFQLYVDSPNGSPAALHGPFIAKIHSYSTDEKHHLGELSILTIHFAKTTLAAGHYWFKLSCFCSEAESSGYALATATVKNDEGWVTTPDYTGPISASPFVLPPHDIAFALIFTAS
jgi:hypothetical protein